MTNAKRMEIFQILNVPQDYVKFLVVGVSLLGCVESTMWSLVEGSYINEGMPLEVNIETAAYSILPSFLLCAFFLLYSPSLMPN